MTSFLVACALGCSGGATTESAPHTTSAPPSEPAPPTGAPDACDVHRAAFRAAMASATGACSDASECGCFNPVVGEAGCGGITDAATATRLGEIERAFHEDDCPWPHACPAWSCVPTCEAGRCVNGTLGGQLLPP